MRCFLYLITACLFSFTAGAKSFDGIDTNNFCDPPLVFSATICSGESITRGIQAPDPASTYNWYADAAHSILLATGTSFATPVLFATTEYYVLASSGTCTAEKIITITVNTLVLPILHGDTGCTRAVLSDSVRATVLNPQPGYTYNWYISASGGTIVNTGVFLDCLNYFFVGSSQLVYWVEAVNGNCTSPRILVQLYGAVNLPPPFVFGADICPGETTTLTVNNPDNAYTYHWYPSGEMGGGVSGNELHVALNYTPPPLNVTTTYYVIAAENYCLSSANSVTVNVHVIPAPIANNITICPGASAQLSVQNPTPGNTYTWYQVPEGGAVLNTGINFTTAPISAPTTFYVGANDGVCATVSTLTPVEVNFPLLDSPIVTATHADFNNVTFSWLPVTNTGSYEVSVNGGPFITPSSGSMGLTHTVSGLSHSQPVSITVKAIPSAQFCGNASYGHAAGSTYGVGFYVPSAFTPNGDTRNDILKPIIPFGSILEYFTIYDRWGKMIFTTNKNVVGWDGKVAGKGQPVGTYVWICRYLFAGRTEIEEKGSFVLLR